MHQLNPARSQEILSSAITFNRQVTKPIAGIRYSKLDAFNAGQAKSAVEFLKQFEQANDLVIWANALVDDLRWDPDETKTFETAIENLGRMIGYNSQRPERDLNKGPDNLWALGGLAYLVIECKSGAVSATISKKDSDQLTGSMNWFEAAYDRTCTGIPIMIHPTNVFDKQSAPHAKAKIIDSDSLKKLRGTILDYAVALGAKKTYLDPDGVADLLKHFRLTSGTFLDAFTTKFKIQK